MTGVQIVFALILVRDGVLLKEQVKVFRATQRTELLSCYNVVRVGRKPAGAIYCSFSPTQQHSRHMLALYMILLLAQSAIFLDAALLISAIRPSHLSLPVNQRTQSITALQFIGESPL